MEKNIILLARYYHIIERLSKLKSSFKALQEIDKEILRDVFSLYEITINEYAEHISTKI